MVQDLALPCPGEVNPRRHGVGRGGGLAVAVAGVGAVASPPGAGRAGDGLVGAGCVRCGCSARWLAASPPRTATSVSSLFCGASITPGAGTASKGRPGWANRPRAEPMASRRCLSRRLSGPIGRGSRPGLPAVPDSPEWLHARIQAGVLAELHGIGRAAERRVPEAG